MHAHTIPPSPPSSPILTHTQFSGASPEKLVVTTKHFLESESKGAYSPGKGYRWDRRKMGMWVGGRWWEVKECVREGNEWGGKRNLQPQLSTSHKKGEDTLRRRSRNVCFQPSLVLRPSLAPVFFLIARSMLKQKEKTCEILSFHQVDRHGGALPSHYNSQTLCWSVLSLLNNEPYR